MTDNNIHKVRTFIFENLIFDSDNGQLGNDDSFMRHGIIDSTGVLELIGWVEDEYGIVFDDEELVPENLDSVNNLVAYIAMKNS